MIAAFPDAMVDRERYERLIQVMTNNPKDRHVLAAAIAARADVLVTFNTRDFPHESVALYAIEIQDPDTFLCHQFDLRPDMVLESLALLSKERRDPMNSVENILRALEKQAPNFSSCALKLWCKYK